jgi:hypothetical protein
MCLEQQFPDIGEYYLYNGCMVSKFACAFELNNADIVGTVDIAGTKETISTTSFCTAPTTIPMVKFSQFMSSIKVGGSAIADATKLDLTIDAGLDTSIYAIGGGGFRTSIPVGMLAISGTLTALFDSESLLNLAVNGTDSSIEINLANSISGHSLDILLPEVMFERTSPGIDGPKGISIAMPFRAFYSTNSNGVSLVSTLINGQATY